VIVPIRKINAPTVLSDYRPISIQTNLAKIIEKCFSTCLIDYVNKNSMLSPLQFGFRKNSSTEHALLAINDYILKNLSENKVVVIVQLDLTKAFD